MGIALNTKTDAFGALYASNQGRIRGLLSRMVGPQEAEDLTQVTFAKAAQALPAFRGKAEVSTWLYRLAVNVALDWLRSRLAHEAKLTGPLPEPSTEDNAGALTSVLTMTLRCRPSRNSLTKTCMRASGAKSPNCLIPIEKFSCSVFLAN